MRNITSSGCGVQSLSGHTSAVESVSFDSSEVLVAAGAASGTIKLWDLEEAKSMDAYLLSPFLIDINVPDLSPMSQLTFSFFWVQLFAP